MSSVEFHNAPGRVMFRKICRLLQVCLSSNIMLHLAARYLVGALSLSPILKIGPVPAPAPPGSTPALEPGVARPRLSASRQDAAHVARVPAATECSSTTTRDERTALFCPLRRRFTALRLISFRKHRRMHDSNGTAAHRAVEVSRLLPSVWRLVVPRAVFGLLPNHLRDPFC